LALLGVVCSACAGGTRTDFGVSGTTISLGILTPLTGPVADPIGKPLTRGIEVFFDAVNAHGGIAGYTVQLVERDSRYDPRLQVQAYDQIHAQVLMLAESLGTEPTFAIKERAIFDHMLVSAATFSSDLAREQYLILVGTPYRLQVENAFDYVTQRLGVQQPRTGIIYQSDDYGLDGLTGYLESAAAYHLRAVAQARITQGQPDMRAAVRQMQQAAAQYVFLTTLPGDTANLLLTAHTLGYDPQWILQSPAYSSLLLGVPGLAPILAQHAWVVNQGADWGDRSKPGMAAMLDAIARYAPDQKPDQYFELGYTQARITYAILQKAAASGDLTRDGVYRAFASIGTIDLGGLYPQAHYGTSGNPNDRVPTRDNTIYAIDLGAPGTGFLQDLSGDFVGQAALQSQF
jgi:ABC-type branched-subunit amino acid transport system substrate-binding protein